MGTQDKVDTIKCNNYYDPDTYKYESVVEKDHTNILLLALSTLGNPRETDFTSKISSEEVHIFGAYQLDPVPKLMKLEFEKEGNGDSLDKIVMLCSKETLEVDKERGYSAIDFFYNNIKDCFTPIEGVSDEDAFCKRFDIIKLDEDNLVEGISNAVKSIRNERKPRLYIDPHGGFRNAQFSLLAIISLLKQTDSPDIIKNVYEVQTDNKGKGNIYKRNDAIGINDFVSGINEFINYGRIDTLEKYIESEEPLVKAISTVSEGIAMCNIVSFDEGIRQVKEYFDKGEEPADRYLSLFKETIEKDFEGMIQTNSNIEKIKWCMRKGFVQQAITIITDRMYEDMKNDGILQIDSSVEEKAIKRLSDIEKKENKEKYKRTWELKTFNAFNFNYEPRASKNNLNTNWRKDFNKYIASQGYGFLSSEGVYNISETGIWNPEIKYDKEKEVQDALLIKKEVSFNDDIPEFHQFMRLHRAIRDIRNCSNHASDKNPYDVKTIRAAANQYVELYEKLVEITNSKANEKATEDDLKMFAEKVNKGRLSK